MNDALIFLRQVRLARQLLDVVAVRLSARYSPGGSMRLLEKACVGQVGHDIADGRGTQSLTIATRQGARSYRLARGYEGFGDRRSRRWLLKWGTTLGSLTAISNRFGLPSRAPAAILNDHDRAQIKMKTQTHIAVIGAGAFGGWTALYLLRRGARVTLIDSWGPGNSRAS